MSNDSGVLDRVYTCPCGHKMRVSEFQLGMEITCPECKTEVVLREANTTPIVKAPPTAPSSPRPTEFSMENGDMLLGKTGGGPVDDDVCSRCGKKFRGDWDKQTTIMGDVCNVCANLAMDGGPETLRLASGGAQASTTPTYDLDGDPFRAQPPPAPTSEASRKPRWMEEHPFESKVILWSLAALVILLALWASTVEPPNVDETSQAGAARVTEALSAYEKLPFYVTGSIHLLFAFLRTALPLYFVLRFNNKLPFDTWWVNAIEIGWVCGFLAVIATVTGFVPIVGGIVGLFFTIYFLWSRYEFGLTDFLLLMILGTVCGVLLWAVQMMVFGAIAQVML